MELTCAEADRVCRHLQDVKDSPRPEANRLDRTVVLIGTCFANDFDERGKIIKGLRVLGLDTKYVVGILDEQTGTVPGIHLWRRDEVGRYHPLEG